MKEEEDKQCCSVICLTKGSDSVVLCFVVIETSDNYKL